MEIETIYCPRCDGEVKTTVTPAPDHSTHASVRGGEMICLDLGKGCTHGDCPLSHVSGVVMAVRLARSGMKDQEFETIRAHCEGCRTPTQLKVIDKSLAICTECGATNRWVRLRADGGYIILTGVEVAP